MLKASGLEAEGVAGWLDGVSEDTRKKRTSASADNQWTRLAYPLSATVVVLLVVVAAATAAATAVVLVLVTARRGVGVGDRNSGTGTGTGGKDGGGDGDGEGRAFTLQDVHLVKQWK